MGMFDEVIADFECPYCGFKVPKDTWQTKANAKLLDFYKTNDKLEIDDLSKTLRAKARSVFLSMLGIAGLP